MNCKKGVEFGVQCKTGRSVVWKRSLEQILW